MPETLYHFTSPAQLSAILRSGYIALTESNLNTREGNCGVVWLTSSPDPTNHGLKFGEALSQQLDKTAIRISLSFGETFRWWDEWSDEKGMDGGFKEALIRSAGAEETYRTWYISESVIPVNEFLRVEKLATGEVIAVEDAVKILPDEKPLVVRFRNEIDAYIVSQPTNIQVLLLYVRQTIRQALPEATEKISWQMPTYWQGRNLIHFAAQKNHLGIYPGAEAMEYFAPRLTGYKTSKGAIQFPYKSFGEEQMKLVAEIAAWTLATYLSEKERG